ncbi:MAG TPA: hypothetical protein VE866_11390, partial [Candidatus Binatia bacterium]|nr:hypothetical protein [Candidatus Binatia bacterium]
MTFMNISPEKANSGAATADFRLPKILRILHLRISLCAALTGFLVCLVLVVTAAAQEERPQIVPGERKVAQKKDAGPRAVAILRMDAKGKVSLVPIAIMINGKFWDASAYKADPVPMALDSGTVYEGERSGSSLGLFTVGSALHSNSANVPTPWIATGVWRATGSEPEKKVTKAETKPADVTPTDQPPRLTHTPTNTSTAPESGKAPASTTAPSPSTSSASPSGSDKSNDSANSGDGPPRLTKPSSPSSESPGPSQTGSSQPAQKSPATGTTKSDAIKPDDKANIPASDSGTREANRPVLRRGKPVESFADEDVPGYSPPGIRPAAATATKAAEIAPVKDESQIVPAISDAGGPEPRSYAFEWVKGDEEDRRKQMLDLAKSEVRGYVAARAKARITPNATHTGTPHTTTARRSVKTPDPILENVQMTAYDLWNSNQPIIVLSATAHMPPPTAGSAHIEADADLEYSILLVTYPDIYNNLHKLYSGVTDKFH